MNTSPLLVKVRAFIEEMATECCNENTSQIFSEDLGFVREALSENCAIFDLKLQLIGKEPAWRILSGADISDAAIVGLAQSYAEFEWMEYTSYQENTAVGFLAIRSIYNPENVTLHIFENSKSGIKRGYLRLKPVILCLALVHIVKNRIDRGVEPDYDKMAEIAGLMTKKDNGDFTTSEINNYILDWLLINEFKGFVHKAPIISGNRLSDCDSSMLCLTKSAATLYAARNGVAPRAAR